MQLYLQRMVNSSSVVALLILRLLLFSCLAICTMGSEGRHDELLRSTAIGICKNGFDLDIFQSVDGRYCCKCPAGECMSQLCLPNHNAKPQSRVCTPCPFNKSNPDEQTWMDIENNYTHCFPSLGKNECDKFLNAHLQIGSTTENSRCVCNDGYHLANQSASDVSGGCHVHSLCPAGFQPLALANEQHDTQCEACPLGTFSNFSSAEDLCVNWTICGQNENMTSEGNATHDSVCTNDQLPNEPAALNGTETNPEILASSGLSAGQIVGIVVAVIIIIGVAVLIKICCERKHCNTTESLCRRVKYMKGKPQPIEQTENQLHHSAEGGGSGSRESSNNGSVQHIAGVQNTGSPRDSQTVENGQQQQNIADISTEPVNACETLSETGLVQNQAHPPLSRLDQERYLVLCPGFEVEMKKAQDVGCLNCCLDKHLDDFEVGKRMMWSLEGTNTETLVAFLRLFELSDVREEDIKKENLRQQDIRHQLILDIIQHKGRELTPSNILNKEISVNSIRDKMLKEFFRLLSPCQHS